MQKALSYRNRRLNKDLLVQLTEYAENELERRGATQVDLDLFVAELGTLLHDKKLLTVLEEDETLSEHRRKRMQKRAEMLKTARKNATKYDREQIRKSITFQLFVGDINKSPKGIEELYKKYLEEQANKKNSKGLYETVASNKHKSSFINCVKGMLDN